MARTRAQEKGGSSSTTGTSNNKRAPHGELKDTKQTPASKPKIGSKRKAAPNSSNNERSPAPKSEPPAKKTKTKEPANPTPNIKIKNLINTYCSTPLAGYGLQDSEAPTAETILAHLFNAMLTSARISHELAEKSVKCLIEAGWADVKKLKESSWEKRTEVLTDGGYTRYREKTATGLGELAELITEKYHGDLNNLRKKANDDPQKIRELIKEIKGFGDVGTNIFTDTVQYVWPSMSPFVDPRSLKTAEAIGLSTDQQELFEAVGKDHKNMARLCVALTTVRLQKREKEFT